jgi:hypothetical protein
MKEVLQLTYNIVTGPHPSHPGACIAQYNHYDHHSSHHNPNHHYNPNHNPNFLQNQHHIIPYIQHPIPAYNYYPLPNWRPPGAPFPTLY